MIPVRAYWRLLKKYLRPLRARVALLAVLLFTGIAFQVINPQLIRSFIDGAQQGADTSRLLSYAAAFVLLAVGHQALSVTSTYFAEQVGWTATNEMRADLAEHLLDLDMSFHKTKTPGELIERIDGDVTTLSNFFSAFVIHVVGNSVLVASVVFLMWREHPLIGIGMTAFALVAGVLMIGLQAVAIPWWRAVRAKRAEFFGFLGEQLGGTEDIRANGAVPYMMHRFTLIHREWLPMEVRGRWGFSMLWATSIAVYVFGLALVFGLGSRLLTAGTVTIGAVYLVFHYTEMIRHPIDQIRTQMEDLQKAGAGISRVEELFAARTHLPENGTRHLPQGPLAVQFDDVSFAYRDEASDGEAVLNGIDLDLAPGRVLGLLGRTGSGKSTMARLITRLYDPTEGAIRVGGIDLREVDRTDRRARIGMVTQEVQLFRATVRENLTFFDDRVDDEEIWTVLLDLGLGDWIFGLADGLDTMLESGSGGLSAGQAQLLAFARIFLRDPGVVILDEASSRLDPATEVLIERAVDRLLENRTGIVIAHRLATVDRADDILILEKGEIVEYGVRHQLAADEESRFATLLRTGMEELLA
ncbi:MAG TPA: ABC transporter ATP-binding protein [Acidimicrobiia bacterium]|nr:ABC transporter ATP-binding protein [Acidimicrobiia bacterium]